MKFLKIAVLSVVLPLALFLGGCATFIGPETTITGFQKVSSFENKKVALSLPVVVEKDMETKKNPDTTEKAVADEVYTKLKENLNQKGLLASKDSASLSLDLRVHYVNKFSFFTVGEYFPGRLDRNSGGQVIVVKGIITKNNKSKVVQISSIDNTGTVWNYKTLTDRMCTELANQIEKILKEGVNVGKSP